MTLAETSYAPHTSRGGWGKGVELVVQVLQHWEEACCLHLNKRSDTKEEKINHTYRQQ